MTIPLVWTVNIVYDLAAFLELPPSSSSGALLFPATLELLLVPTEGSFFCFFGVDFLVCEKRISTFSVFSLIHTPEHTHLCWCCLLLWCRRVVLLVTFLRLPFLLFTFINPGCIHLFFFLCTSLRLRCSLLGFILGTSLILVIATFLLILLG
jgi:hypothetical protein